MNATVGNSRTRNWEFLHGHFPTAAIVATVVLGILLGVGAWRAFGGATADTPVLTAPTAHTTMPADIPMRVYIVADEAQKAKVLYAEDEAAMVRFAGGDFKDGPAVDVIVATKGPQFDRLLLDIETANGIRIQQGLEPMPVVDLR